MRALYLLCSFFLPLAAVAAQDLPAGDWVRHGFTDAQRQELQALLRETARNKEVSGGALLLIHKGEVIFREAFGYADLETKRAFGATTPASSRR